LIGALLGLFHATYVYRLVMAEAATDAAPGHARAANHAVWTFGLWLVLGSYVLALWLVSVVLYAVFKAFR
jgi:hypothetical protein